MQQRKLMLKEILSGLLIVCVGLVLSGCDAAAQSEATEVAEASSDMEHSMAQADGHRAELEFESPVELNPARGKELGAIYEAFLSPHQEGDDEEDTPAAAPDVFKSTAPSVPRNERTSHGHGVISFTNDLSKAYVHVAIENVDPEEIVMFHIHCGRPGQLGPIIVDFGLAGNLTDYFEDGEFSIEVTNDDIEAAVAHGEGIVGAFTAGCPITAALPLDKVKTIGGMQFIAEQGELYFNLHTAGQTFFGDIRGQLARVE